MGREAKRDVPAEPVLIDMGELAAMLAVGRSTLERWLAAGYLPEPIRLGRLLRWRRADVLAWIEDGAPRPARGRR